MMLMTFDKAGDIVFSAPVLLAFVAFCVYTIAKGRPELAVGMFVAIGGWTRNFMVGPIVQNYVLAFTMYAALAVRLYHRPDEIKSWLPRHDRGIVFWMLLWWGWMILLLEAFATPRIAQLRPSLILFLIFPLPVILSFSHDMKRISHFAIAFIATSLFGGYTAMAALKIPLITLLIDPVFSNYPAAAHMGIYNYHFFAYMFAISAIMIMAMLLQARSTLSIVLLLAAAASCAQFLLLAGSRQSIGGTMVVLGLFALWGLKNRSTNKLRLLLIIGTVLGVSIPIYIIAPNLVIRSGEKDVLQAFDLVNDRSQYWVQGWEAFLGSPIWGTAFWFPYSHNMFISTLAEQGLVGTIFLLGYFYFLMRQVRVVVNGRGEEDRAIWRVAFLGIVIFGLTHGLASGSALSVRHMFWGGALLWWQSTMVHPAPIPQIVKASRVVALPRQVRPTEGAA